MLKNGSQIKIIMKLIHKKVNISSMKYKFSCAEEKLMKKISVTSVFKCLCLQRFATTINNKQLGAACVHLNNIHTKH